MSTPQAAAPESLLSCKEKGSRAVVPLNGSQQTCAHRIRAGGKQRLRSAEPTQHKRACTDRQHALVAGDGNLLVV